ncbi:type I-E CRISPR-associated protein Cse2/CasB [Actinomadura kijaniata]|uniref:type I-E CRISPR-associated protein Cse2/CasB n=1 Tax=Actinomadura kijaniata TaxID=46161 RepID=UPI003F1C5114
MTDKSQRYWNQHVRQDGTWRIDPTYGKPNKPPGEDLADFRAGLGQLPGSVPRLWRHYTCDVDERLARKGELSYEQAAEHAALALYGLHQQSQDRPMHRPGIGLGTALRALRKNEKFSEDAVDARVAALVTATSVPALLMRLRGLITQLRDIGQPLDYDRLMDDIRAWHRADRRPHVRRAWGVDYHAWEKPTDGKDNPKDR